MADPLYVSGPGPTGEGVLGAKVLGFDPMPAQLALFGVLGAGFGSNVLQIPRRTGKTEGLFCVAVGRSIERGGYVVAYTAQTGVASRRRFMGLANRLQRRDIDCRISRANGREAIAFPNGSEILFFNPDPGSWRGDAIDLILIDEAQEIGPEKGLELMGAVLPTQDTRPGGQLVVSGTAGSSRSGLLWEQLLRGRRGVGGVLDYAAPDGFDPDDEAGWLSVHPGPAGVTEDQALDVLRRRHAELGAEQFGREYLGIWGESALGGFTPELWMLRGTEQLNVRPAVFGVGLDVPPGGDSASVCAAYVLGDGRTVVELLGESSVPDVVRFVRSSRVPLTYDPMSVESVVFVEAVKRAEPRAQLVALSTLDAAAACAAFSAGVVSGSVAHLRQPALSEAVVGARRRPVRDGGWLWGRRVSGGSIAPLVAATWALRALVEAPVRPSFNVVT